MKILVTGGNGFIGSNFIDYMLQKNPDYTIHNVDKMTSVAGTWIDEKWGDFKCYRKTELDINALEENCRGLEDFNDVDVCVHFAAESHVDKSIDDVAPFILTNIQGTLAMAQFCDKRGIPMIHISTDEVYGHLESLNDDYFKTTDPLEPRNPYAASKASAELMLKAYANVSNTFQYYIIRPANNYGPHQDRTKFLPKLIHSLYTNEPFPMYGRGDYYREWTWVFDTARCIECVIESIPTENGKVFNVSSNERLSNFDLAMMVTEKMRSIKTDTVANIQFVKCPRGNAHDRIYSIENSIFKFQFITIEEGIDAMLNEFFNSDNCAG